jgi:transcriptional regulator with XRE-family HTH domain
MVHIGETARYLRTVRGVTQREAANQLGVSVVHLCNIEKGRATPSEDLLERFTQLWGVDLYVLAWCRHGDIDKLPPAVRRSARALAKSWQEEIDVRLRTKHRRPSSCSTSEN